MDLDEHAAKELLAASGIAIPRGEAVSSPEQARAAASRLGAETVVKALVPRGGRGKAGLVRFADGPERAEREARDLLAKPGIERVRVEERADVARELYLAVVTDRSARAPVLLYSEAGGVDVEEGHAFIERPVDIRSGPNERTLDAFPPKCRTILERLYATYRQHDAELVEINPLAETADGKLLALDAKIAIDDSARYRHPELPEPQATGTKLERRARAAGLYYVELEGEVGVLANGAGLTMATLDAVRHHGGRPANFMEIGGDAYKKAEIALEIVLDHPKVRSLLVNLCGAYARTDVMVDGFLAGWRALRPDVPVSFSIHGTGADEAVRRVIDALGIRPHEEMTDAVREAVSRA